MKPSLLLVTAFFLIPLLVEGATNRTRHSKRKNGTGTTRATTKISLARTKSLGPGPFRREREASKTTTTTTTTPIPMSEEEAWKQELGKKLDSLLLILNSKFVIFLVCFSEAAFS